MKNLLLILLLANILYFVWGVFSDKGGQPGVVIVDEGQLGPPLAVMAYDGDESIASVGAVLGSGEPSALAAVVGRSCVTLGPFRESVDAETAQTQYAGEGMRTFLRSAQGEIFVGHWVQIRTIPDRATANQMLDKLKEGGLTDAYLIDNDDGSYNISLGLFGDIDRAERVELQAKSLDLPAGIMQRTREGTIYFVDIGLPPGKGAGAMIEQYGEDRVLLREQATCP